MPVSDSEQVALPAPAGWDCVALDAVVDVEREISYGIVQPGTHDPSGVPIVRVNNLRGGRVLVEDVLKVSPAIEANYSRTRLRGGEVLLSLVGTLGECAVVPPDLAGWNVARAVAVIPVKRGIDPRWVAMCLRSREVQSLIRAWATTTVQATLNLRDVRRLPLLLATQHEREEITLAVTALDDKIEHNRRTSRALEGLARAMFKAWFVDFEPVHAKAAGATAYPGMPPEAFAALPMTFADSPLGAVPEGWGVGTLGDHCGINLRSVRKGEINGEIEYVDIASVTVGRLDAVQRMPFAEAPSRARRRLAHGDTIWSCVRPNHRSYLFIHSPPDHRLVSTGFAVLSPGGFGPSFLHELTTRQDFVDYLVANAHGSAYPAVRPEHFAAAQVIVPPEGLRRAFEGLTMPFRDLIAALDVESRKLAELRDYLLPKLLSGEVRVATAERAVGAAP